MRSSFVIFPSRNLIYVRHHGYSTAAEVLDCLDAIHCHRDFNFGQNFLSDCSGIVEYERDPFTILETQLVIADRFDPALPQTVQCLYATDGPGRDLVIRIARSWSVVSHVKTRLAETEEQALSILGQRETTFAAFFESAQPKIA